MSIKKKRSFFLKPHPTHNEGVIKFGEIAIVLSRESVKTISEFHKLESALSMPKNQTSLTYRRQPY